MNFVNFDLGGDDFYQNIFQTYEKEITTQPNLNIIIAGKTGVGKSTLINAVFGEDVAKTGEGKPVTKGIKPHINKEKHLTIYDTEGFELDNVNNIYESIIDLINKKNEKSNIKESIHCIWYCISAASDRVEDKELELIGEFLDRNKTTYVPIVIILTKCSAKKNREQMLNFLKEHLQKIQEGEIIPVHAIDYEINDDVVIKKFGLEELIKYTNEKLPSKIRSVFIRNQVASLNEKINESHKIVNKFVLTASAAAASPIPFSDAVTLIPIQVAMIAKITYIFGFDIPKSIIMSFVSAAAGTTATTFLGRSIVTNLIKIIPGANVVSGVISASTAGILTKGLGEAYITLMTKLKKGEIKIEDIASESNIELVKNIITEALKNHHKRPCFIKGGV